VLRVLYMVFKGPVRMEREESEIAEDESQGVPETVSA